MKRILLSILFLVTLSLGTTWAAGDVKYLPISVVVGELTEPFPAGAQALIQSKLTQLLTRNGIAGDDYQGQFALTVVTVPLDKDIIPGPPAKIAEKMELNFYIVDMMNRTVFSSTSVVVRGLGETETKCYMNAISNMPMQSKQLGQFIEEGKQKIIRYYEDKAPQMIKQAQMLAKQKQFDEALFIISQVPQECSHYDAAIAAGLKIFQAYQDEMCNRYLAQARTAWMSEQNSEGAKKAGEYLKNILPDAACYGDAMALYKEIKGKVMDDWKFEMKQYQDGIDLERQRIQAMRDIGVAYGQHQPNQNTDINFIPLR